MIVVVPFALLSATLAHEAVGLLTCIQSGETSPVPLRDALDDTALAGCVAAFEQDHDLAAGLRLPVLRFDQLCLQAKELLKVAKARSRASRRSASFFGIRRPGWPAPKGPQFPAAGYTRCGWIKTQRAGFGHEVPRDVSAAADWVRDAPVPEFDDGHGE